MTAVPIDHSARRRPEPAHRRTHQPVLRYSRLAGGERPERISKRSAALHIFSLDVYRKTLRKKGQRHGGQGTISQGARDMYGIVVSMMSKTGLAIPSAASLAEMCNVPISQIHRWKDQLKAHGFLDWRRRYIETGRDGQRGPQVEQTSNAYILRLPKAALELVRKIRFRMGLNPDPFEVTEKDMEVMEPRARRKEEQLKARKAAAKARLTASIDSLGQAIRATKPAPSEPPERESGQPSESGSN